MQITLYNTLSRSKETFVPISEDEVKLYTCGPTVYSKQHMGNMRGMFVSDFLKLVVKHIGGYKVKHVMNITDVGHLTGDNEGDANTGEDRMEKGARKEGLTARDVAEKYTQIYINDLKTLGISVTTDMKADPERYILMPRATDHIQEQIDMIQQLEAKGHTYIVPGDGVYMDASTIPNYGVLLSEKHLEGLEEGSRVDLKGKRNSTDFALWKFNMTGKKRDMERESPRGIGFPGRHIECSAMSIKYLGEQFDIHMGGMEHIPVHHTNEIAQAECSCSSTPRVNYRFHYQRLMMNGAKISKSTGNVAFVEEATEKGYTGEDIRCFFLQAHYRSFQDFTREGLASAKTSRKNLIKKLAKTLTEEEVSDEAFGEYTSGELYEKMAHMVADDLDTVQVLTMMHTHADKDTADSIDILLFDEKITKLGLRQGLMDSYAQQHVQAPAEIQTLAQQRLEAKQDKNYDLADQLREQISQLGWEVKDVNGGFELSQK